MRAKKVTSSLDEMPTTVKANLRALTDVDLLWSSAYRQVQNLAILLLAICHVQTLDACDALSFSAHPTVRVPLLALLRS